MADARWAAFIGREIPPGKPFEVTAEAVRKFALAVGEARPEFLDGSVAPPSFANHIFRMAQGRSMDALNGLVTDPLKILHAGQAFEFLAPVRAGDVLTASGRVRDVTEKSGMLWIQMESVARDRAGGAVIRAVGTLAVRPGGYRR